MLEFAWSGTRLRLPLPCPLNRYWRPVTRYKLGKSTEAKENAKLLVDEIRKQVGRPVPVTGPVSVQVRVVPRDRRIPDIDAYAKQLLDVLAHSGVIENDRQVVHLTVERERVPEYPGHLEVGIYPLPGRV